MILVMLLACASDKGDDTSGVGEELVTSLSFRAVNGQSAFSCGADLSGLGTAASTVTPNDLRFYVHGVELLDASGAATPFALEADGTWQTEDVALLDFEDDSGDCATGSPDTHTALTGEAPAGDYTALRFELGVPDALNHLDVATAAPPLNDSGMYWSWTGGYKFLKIDVTTPEDTGFVFHLGATDCTKNDDGSYDCTLENAASITVDGFDPAADDVVLDLAALYAEADLSGAMVEGDMMPGCMSSEGDPECTPLFDALGLPWADNTAPGAQTVFSAAPR